MRKILGLTLGIMTALGGFVDLGQIVFTTQAGSLFGYSLLWAIVLGTAAIIVYMEMCGRVAVIARQPVFSVVRNRLGFRLGLATLVASNLLNVITCAAELGGIAVVLHLLTGWPEKLLLIIAAFTLCVMVLVLQFEWVERTFGLTGLLMIVFAVSALAAHPDWSALARGLLPIPTTMPPYEHPRLLYAYFAVGIFSAMLMEYEVHFYSSGAIEEDWSEKDLSQNFMVASIGSVLGSFLTVALLVLGAVLFLPKRIFPDLLSTAIFAGAHPFARKALLFVLLGTMACIAGAAVETALSGAYNACQFFHREWGKSKPVRRVPFFNWTFIGMFAVALVIALTGVKPLQLVNFSIIFGMVIMPLTYYPILRVAGDKNFMGKHVNGKGDTAIAVAFLVLITIAAIAAIPLMVLTNFGKPS